jgi:molybdopterin-containing oxidoreductase family membrane subunit
MLAGLAVPLVFSVHSVVALDFAAGNTPGWHSTIFPPFFVDGALFSGFSMVLTLAVPMRAVFGLQDLITERHLDNIAKAVLATGLLLAYSYLIDIFIAFYSGSEYEIYTAQNRMFGPYAPVYWATIFCNVVVTQLLWFQCIRLNPLALFIISIIINIGMWLERFMLIVTSLHRDFLPSAWGMFYPTFWDWATLIGSIGFFFILFLLFVRFLPAISVYEMRELVAETEGDKR